MPHKKDLMKPIEAILTDLLVCPDFVQTVHDNGISGSELVQWLSAQARRDRHFMLATREQHILRFGHYAKHEKSKQTIDRGVDRKGSAGSNQSRGQSQNRRERVYAVGGMD